MKKDKVCVDESDKNYDKQKFAPHIPAIKLFIDSNIIYYVAHTGFVGTSFDKYPEWFKVWSAQNYFKLENNRLCLMNQTSNSLRHEFSIGDPVIFFEKDNIVECGARAMIRLITGFSNN